MTVVLDRLPTDSEFDAAVVTPWRCGAHARGEPLGGAAGSIQPIASLIARRRYAAAAGTAQVAANYAVLWQPGSLRQPCPATDNTLRDLSKVPLPGSGGTGREDMASALLPSFTWPVEAALSANGLACTCRISGHNHLFRWRARMSSVDVIVPCYRYGHFLRECVRSVLTQEFDNFRVLIIDDASPDNTAEVASILAGEDRRVQVITHEYNRGHIATYNEGIGRSTADYLIVLSADDMLTPGALSRAVALLDADKKVSFVYGQALVRRQDGSEKILPRPEMHLNREVISGPEFVRVLGGQNHVYTPTVLIRRQAQIAAGGYRPDLPHAGDMEMWLRLAVHGSVGFIAMPQAIYRLHGSNMTNEYIATWIPDLQQKLKAIESFFAGAGATLAGSGELYWGARRPLAQQALSLAGQAFNHGDLTTCAQLRAFSFSCDDRSRTSAAAMRLAVKQALGPRLCCYLLPIARVLTAKWRPLQPE